MNVVPQFQSRNKCPLCGSDRLGDYFVLDGIRIAACHTCGFIFARDTLLTPEIEQFYAGYQGQRRMDGQRVNATININVLRSFYPDFAGCSLLDIGSGYGFLIEKARDYGMARVVGVELSQVQRTYSIEKLKLQTFSQLDDLSTDAQFDIVTAFEVIEHIPEPREFIRRACGQLKTGGSLIIGTDNFNSNVVNTLGCQFPKWIPHEHISHFTAKTLKQMLETTETLRFAGGISFTPWELCLRQLIFQATSGRRGGKIYNHQNEILPANHKGYRFFPLRFMINHMWFNLTKRANLDGEMMFIHMIKE